MTLNFLIHDVHKLHCIDLIPSVLAAEAISYVCILDSERAYHEPSSR